MMFKNGFLHNLSLSSFEAEGTEKVDLIGHSEEKDLRNNIGSA